MAYSALYYPHTGIKTLELMKLSLLLWDQVEYIFPFEGYRSDSDNPLLDEGAEILARPLCPSLEEKQLAHKLICDLVEAGIPEWVTAKPVPGFDRNEFFVFREKLLTETWQVLADAGFGKTRIRGLGHNTSVPASLGLLMMSVLAECCAGTEKKMITDRTRAYSVLTHTLAQVSGGNHWDDGDSVDILKEQNARERLIAVTLRTFRMSETSIESLIALRKREEKEPGRHLRALRHNYVDSIGQWATRIVTEARTNRDVMELERQYEEALRIDCAELTDQLKLDATKLFSRELLISVSVSAATLSTIGNLGLMSKAVYPVFAGAVGVATLGNKLVEYRLQRKEALKNHVAGYLYSARGFRVF
jgi:hypothetical protein